MRQYGTTGIIGYEECLRSLAYGYFHFIAATQAWDAQTIALWIALENLAG